MTGAAMAILEKTVCTIALSAALCKQQRLAWSNAIRQIDWFCCLATNLGVSQFIAALIHNSVSLQQLPVSEPFGHHSNNWWQKALLHGTAAPAWSGTVLVTRWVDGC